MRTRDDARPCRQKVCTSPQPIPSNHPWLGCVIQIKAKKHADGGWAADIVVKGTHTGSAWTPMPGKLPPIELKEPPTSWTIGPEEFKVWKDSAPAHLREVACELISSCTPARIEDT